MLDPVEQRRPVQIIAIARSFQPLLLRCLLNIGPEKAEQLLARHVLGRIGHS